MKRYAIRFYIEGITAGVGYCEVDHELKKDTYYTGLDVLFVIPCKDCYSCIDLPFKIDYEV